MSWSPDRSDWPNWKDKAVDPNKKEADNEMTIEKV